MLEPDPQTGALYCLAQQVQLHNGHSTHSTSIGIQLLLSFYLLFGPLGREGVSVCASCRNLQPCCVSSMEPLDISGVELVGTGLGPPPPPPPVPTPFVVLCYRYVPAIRSKQRKQQRFRSFEKGGGPPA